MKRVTGTLDGAHCGFGRAIEKATGAKIVRGWHVADLDGAVVVTGAEDPQGVELACAVTVASALSDEDLATLESECARLRELERGELLLP